MLGIDKSLIISRNSQGASLVPWGKPEGTLSHLDKQFLLSLTLYDRPKKIYGPVDDAVRNFDLF